MYIVKICKNLMFIKKFILYKEKFIYVIDKVLIFFDFFIDLEQLVIDQLFFAFILQCII